HGQAGALGRIGGGLAARQLFPDSIDGVRLTAGDRLLFTGAADPQVNGVYEVTKSTLAEAAMKAQPDLVKGVTETLLAPNRLFEQLPFDQNQSHLVYDRMFQNKTVEVNEIKFFDVDGKEQAFPRASVVDEQRSALAGLDFEADLTQDHVAELISGFVVTGRIQELMDKADRPENSFFPRSRVRFKEETKFGFVPAPKENEYA
ncbi:MAG: hypothetical protein V3S25_11075, partial [Nitrospirales bacterium]